MGNQVESESFKEKQCSFVTRCAIRLGMEKQITDTPEDILVLLWLLLLRVFWDPNIRKSQTHSPSGEQLLLVCHRQHLYNEQSWSLSSPGPDHGRGEGGW